MHDDKTQPKTTAQHAEPQGCPFESLSDLLGGAWTLAVLWVLGECGPQRFGSLREAIEGVSSKVLTERLGRMEQDGIVWRQQEGQVPPKVTYGLTEVGMELHIGLKQLSGIAAKLPQSQPRKK